MVRDWKAATPRTGAPLTSAPAVCSGRDGSRRNDASTLRIPRGIVAPIMRRAQVGGRSAYMVVEDSRMGCISSVLGTGPKTQPCTLPSYRPVSFCPGATCIRAAVTVDRHPGGFIFIPWIARCCNLSPIGEDYVLAPPGGFRILLSTAPRMTRFETLPKLPGALTTAASFYQRNLCMWEATWSIGGGFREVPRPKFPIGFRSPGSPYE
jgi:hypothetical protein